MTQIPTPPASRPGSQAPEITRPVASVDLARRLDTLLEQYLHLLDRQQRLQSSLAKDLSVGVFALAQANFSSSPARRYGPDYYDGRMKATRTISIESERNAEGPIGHAQEGKHKIGSPGYNYSFSCKSTRSHRSEKADVNEESQSSDWEQSEPPEATEDTTTGDATGSVPSDPSEIKITPEKPKTDPKTLRSDPINWYGILVPQSLRRAQKSFTNVIDNQVPDLASTTVEMRALEQQINQLRAQLEDEITKPTCPTVNDTSDVKRQVDIGSRPKHSIPEVRVTT
ncbi:uncharacterized protein N7515_008545 [Penicillium bovifimosum]|uniref:Vacuolar ATPase assembly protein VMA22 n=1 Tax=Penicillium bovifimosum TaxID=126998 RepID=A0A9W9KXH9_9EURO|nr:uncharacterized protein N7515_008545 [Penicillium bovifimosum]KAJ5124720.1 hypothetical protein N7515_008545 [Penicillium bovifimosum]